MHNQGTPSELPMPCERFEETILDYFDGTLSASRRTEIESHIEECIGCREFFREQKELDAVLPQKIQIPKLPDDFSAKMLVWAQGQERAHRSINQDELRQRSEQEFSTLLNRIKNRFVQRSMFALLDGFGIVSSAVLLTLAGKIVVSRLNISALSMPTSEITNYAVFGASAAVIAAGIWLANRTNAGLWKVWR